MESNGEENIVPIDVERICGGDNAQGRNNGEVLNSNGSTVKIDSICIDLGIVQKGDVQKCTHFSIRGYVSSMRSSSEELPPMEVANFKYWRCQSCLRDCNAQSTSQETPMVTQCGPSMVKPCSSSCPPQDLPRVVILPFGEGTSGLKPADKRNDDETIIAALREIESQTSPDFPTNTTVSETQITIDHIDPNASASTDADADADVNASANDLSSDIENSNGSRNSKEPMIGPEVQPVHSDHLNDDPNGQPRRKARKVRLLTELFQKKGSLKKSGQSEASPSMASPQLKRKVVQDHDQKKVKVLKVDSAAKMVERNGEGALEGLQNTDKRISKNGNQRSSILGKVGSDLMMPWRSIISDAGKSEKLVLAATVPPLIPAKKSNFSKKTLENHQKINQNQVFGEDLRRRRGAGGSGVRERQSDMELGLGLSLNYDSHVHQLPSLTKQTPNQDHGRKVGFFFGESREGSFTEAVDRNALLQEQRHYYPQFSQGMFSQHQKLDFSDPHNKRNGGVRGYTDVMRTHNHQRRENMFSGGRSDEMEIVELMAKNQYERSLCEARSYYNNNRIPNSSSFPLNEYSNMRKPSSSISTISENVGPTTMRTPVSFFHQDHVPPFAMFEGFLHHHHQNHQQQSSEIRFLDPGAPRHQNQRYYDSNCHNKMGKMPQVLENVWSTVPASMSFGQNNVKFSENNKGKSVMDLDLNVVAPNILEESNKNPDFETLDPSFTKEINSKKHMGTLESSYSNDAIPAMQLLSLMDAGKSSSQFGIEKGEIIGKPFSPCYNHHQSSNLPEKPKSMENSYLLYSGQRPQKPIESSRNSFPPLFQTNQNVKCQVFHKPQQEKPSNSMNYNYRPEGSFVFPLPWHSPEDRRSKCVEFGSCGGSQNGSSVTEVCTVNQNPADFSTPGPANVYMINGEDLIIRGKSSSYKGKNVIKNADGRKRPRIMKFSSDECPQQRKS